VARIRAVLRRTQGAIVGKRGQRFSSVGELRLDVRSQEAFVGRRQIELDTQGIPTGTSPAPATPAEVISRDNGGVFSAGCGAEEVYVATRNVDHAHASLRKKIEDDADQPRYILSMPRPPATS